MPHRITRQTHPNARPETAERVPPPATGIAYLQLVADAHHQQVAADERIGFHALYSSPAPAPAPAPAPGRLPGQMSIEDALTEEQAAGK